MDSLKPDERFMLIAYFQDGRTYEQIGGLLGRRREWASKQIKNTLKKLAGFLRRKCSWHLTIDDIATYLQEADLTW
jgi:hypothetical protein